MRPRRRPDISQIDPSSPIICAYSRKNALQPAHVYFWSKY
jgi:hypothetical protein